MRRSSAVHHPCGFGTPVSGYHTRPDTTASPAIIVTGHDPTVSARLSDVTALSRSDVGAEAMRHLPDRLAPVRLDLAAVEGESNRFAHLETSMSVSVPAPAHVPVTVLSHP